MIRKWRQRCLLHMREKNCLLSQETAHSLCWLKVHIRRERPEDVESCLCNDLIALLRMSPGRLQIQIHLLSFPGWSVVHLFFILYFSWICFLLMSTYSTPLWLKVKQNSEPLWVVLNSKCLSPWTLVFLTYKIHSLCFPSHQCLQK